MADRIIRDEILESERWLTLKDNADRLAFIALILRADSLGNFSAAPFRLLRLWRDFGIGTEEHVAKTLSELADHDLVRLYEVESGKLSTGYPQKFLHIPRFGQRLRHLTRVYPPSPWTTNEQKQKVMNNSPVSHLSRDSLESVEVKRSEEKRSEVKKGVGSSISPTRGAEVKVKPVFKKSSKTARQKQTADPVERNRRIGQALADGDRELAERIKAGRA